MGLEINGLNKYFGKHHAVKDLHLAVGEGQAVGLLGRNGAGKTTTLRMLLGLLTPDGGEILWNGAPFRRRDITLGYLPEERGLYPKMNVLEQLVYFGQLEGMSKEGAKREALRWSEELGITEYLKKDTGELSKGNQQKVQLIAAIMHDPDLIILDEPFSGLDPVNAVLLEKAVHGLMEKNKTMIFSSHRMESVESFCDHIYLLKKGEVVLSGSLYEIKDRYGRKQLEIESGEPLEEPLASLHTAFKKKGRSYQLEVRNVEEGLSLIQQLRRMADIRTIRIADPSLQQIFIEKAGD